MKCFSFAGSVPVVFSAIVADVSCPESILSGRTGKTILFECFMRFPDTLNECSCLLPVRQQA
jgi:hypothetical protein